LNKKKLEEVVLATVKLVILTNRDGSTSFDDTNSGGRSGNPAHTRNGSQEDSSQLDTYSVR